MTVFLILWTMCSAPEKVPIADLSTCEKISQALTDLHDPNIISMCMVSR